MTDHPDIAPVKGHNHVPGKMGSIMYHHPAIHTHHAAYVRGNKTQVVAHDDTGDLGAHLVEEAEKIAFCGLIDIGRRFV